eukprot:3395466-Prymnesium_polylepis.1
MQQTELVDLALDVGLANKAFPMARVQMIFERADQTGDRQAGDNALEFHEFLEAVVLLAFHRANPRFGEVGQGREVEVPLPDCLDQLLHKSLLKKAKTDSLIKVRKRIEKEIDVQLAMRPFRPKLKEEFVTLLGGVNAPPNPRMGMEVFCNDLFHRGVAKECTVRPTPAVQGELLANVHSNLSWLDAKNAFVTCQAADDTDDKLTVTFDEFVMCLALCGHLKYEEVEQMTLPM